MIENSYYDFNTLSNDKLKFVEAQYSVDKLPNKVGTSTFPNSFHSSLERINLEKLASLKAYLKYEIYLIAQQKKKSTTKQLNWFVDNNIMLEKLMNHPIDNSICSSTDLYNHVGYFPSHKYHIKEKDLYYKLGRMYGKGSIQLLSKEIRSILFKDNKYHDFDIQNSHPTLLLEFCNKCKIKSPMLEKYVRERKNFISKLQNSQIPNLSYEQVKKMILKTFNQTPAQLKHSIEKEYKHNKTLTENLSGLHSEVLLAQLKLYDLVLKNSEYSKYKLLFLTHLLQVEFPGRLVCMMANYLQHQETKELLKIFEFIKAQLEIDCKEEINSCFPKYLSKENIFSPFDFNLFIPFFDGFYFSSSNHKIQKRVEELVEKYNNNKKQSDRHLLFVKKEIAVEYKNIDYNLFQKVSNLLYILNESSFQKLTSLRKLLGHENVDLGIQLDKHSDSVHNTSKNNRPELVKTSKTKKKKEKSNTNS